MDNNDQNSFFDKNTLIAVGLTIVVWIGWSQYMAKKYPDQGKAVVQNAKMVEQQKEEATVQNAGANTLVAGEETQSPVLKESKEIVEKPVQAAVKFDFENFSFDVSPRGMGLTNIVLKDYTDRKDKNIRISENSNFYPNFATKLKGLEKELIFEIKKLSETEIVGVYESSDLRIEKKFDIDVKNFTIKTSVNVKGTGTLPNLQTVISDKTLPPAETSFLTPSLDKQEYIVRHKEGTDREIFNLTDPFTGEFESVYLSSMANHYFASAVIDKSEVIPNFKANYDPSNKTSLGYLTYPSFAGTKEINLNYLAYAGPKDLAILKEVDGTLAEIVDFGWFSMLAEPLLGLLKWFYAMLGNWGLAIIGLTLLVRLVVMPFNVMSYKSMKKMQDIQPALKSIREKHKNDQVRMNQEVMAVMSQNKVNPMGGCLPMLIQFPVFIALYRVLSESIDLYKAPFGLWITDLSLKDPYYVLPILMGISMFIQQKITPNTMDPAQQKVMAIMPVMFSLLMVSLPSGLTLYIFVSTLFGIIQQQLFMSKA